MAVLMIVASLDLLPLLLSGMLVQYNIRLFAMVFSFVALLIEQIQVFQHGGIQKACKPWSSLVLETVTLLQGATIHLALSVHPIKRLHLNSCDLLWES